MMDPKEEEEEEERHGTRLSLPVQKEKISEEKILPSPRVRHMTLNLLSISFIVIKPSGSFKGFTLV